MLAGVFEKIRNRCLENYGLCPSDCLSAAALGWNAILNMSKVELDLISDVKCTCFFFLKWQWELVFLVFLKDTVK